MPSDLHIHTTFSDGQLTPEEVVTAAKAAGLSYIAITDHDNVDGIRHLYEQGLYPGKGIRIIPGIEFSSLAEGHDVHILGYNINIYHQGLLDRLNDVVEGRWARFSKMVSKLQTLGYAISEAEVLQIAGTSKSIGRPHIARVLVQKGFFPNIREVFHEVLGNDKPAYVPHYKLEPAEIVELVHEAGGLAVLAHPKLIGDDGLVERLLELPFDGMEVFYPQHEAEDVARYQKIAVSHHLLITGGSDFHGTLQREPSELGGFTIEDTYAAALYRPSAALA